MSQKTFACFNPVPLSMQGAQNLRHLTELSVVLCCLLSQNSGCPIMAAAAAALYGFFVADIRRGAQASQGRQISSGLL